MRGEIIWESPEEVHFSLDIKEKNKKVAEFVEWVNETYDNNKLALFIEANQETFFDNLVGKDYKLSEDKIINKGMKLLKSFKFFETNARALYDIQTRASQIIQEDKVSGKFCISVHPWTFCLQVKLPIIGGHVTLWTASIGTVISVICAIPAL